MNKSFLGRGIAFPLGVDAGGGLGLSSHEENIEQCIRVVLGTAPGERLYRPLFGSRIHDFVFAPNNAHTRNLVSFHAREALLKWEPRVDDIEVEALMSHSSPESILLEIKYKVKATNSHYNMVYPFFLRREEDL